MEGLHSRTAKMTCAVVVALVLQGGAFADGGRRPYVANLGELGGLPIPDGVYGVTFSLWTEEIGGELVWEERLDELEVRDGRLLTLLGATTPLPPEAGKLWLELTVDGDAIAPRTPLGTGGLEVEGQVSAGGLDVGDSLALFKVGDDGWVGSFDGPLKLAGGSGGVSVSTIELRRTFGVGIAHLKQGVDASLADGSGYIVIGDESGFNIVIDNNEIMARNNNGTSTLFLQQEGGAVFVNGSLVHASDARLKREICDLDVGLTAELRKLRPVSYKWKEGGDERRHFGLIAQEVQEISDDLIYEGEDGMLGIAYDELVPLLIRALQLQDVELEALESQLGSFRDRLAALERSR